MEVELKLNISPLGIEASVEVDGMVFRLDPDADQPLQHIFRFVDELILLACTSCVFREEGADLIETVSKKKTVAMYRKVTGTKAATHRVRLSKGLNPDFRLKQPKD